MAFKTLQKRGGKAVAIDEIKKVEGYLTAFRTVTFGRGKNQRTNIIYTFEDGDKRTDVWGAADINGNLLIDVEDPAKGVDETLMGSRVRLTFEGKLKTGKANPMKKVKVEVDLEDRQEDYMESKRGGKPYQLDGGKKRFKKHVPAPNP
jgi:hypothetical protein